MRSMPRVFLLRARKNCGYWAMENVEGAYLQEGVFEKPVDIAPGFIYLSSCILTREAQISFLVLQKFIAILQEIFSTKLFSDDPQILSMRVADFIDSRNIERKKIVLHLKSSDCSNAGLVISDDPFTSKRIPFNEFFDDLVQLTSIIKFDTAESFLEIKRDFIIFNHLYPPYKMSASGSQKKITFRPLMPITSVFNTARKNDLRTFSRKPIGKGFNSSSYNFGLSRGYEIQRILKEVQIQSPRPDQISQLIEDYVRIDIGDIMVSRKPEIFSQYFEVKSKDNFFKQNRDNREGMNHWIRLTQDRTNCFELREILKGIVQRLLEKDLAFDYEYRLKRRPDNSIFNSCEYEIVLQGKDEFLIKLFSGEFEGKLPTELFEIFTNPNQREIKNSFAFNSEQSIELIKKYDIEIKRIDLCSSLPIVELTNAKSKQKKFLKQLAKRDTQGVYRAGVFGIFEDYEYLLGPTARNSLTENQFKDENEILESLNIDPDFKHVIEKEIGMDNIKVYNLSECTFKFYRRELFEKPF